MTKQMLLTLAALPLLAGVNVAHADSVTVGPESTISVDGTSYTLVAPHPEGVMWDTPTKACGCKMFGFRALQAVGDYLGLNDTFARGGMGVTTGWNTHGAEDLYIETFDWVNGGGEFAYASPITASPYLTLADAWYEFTIGGAPYRVQADASLYDFTPDPSHAGYHADWDFFDYRTHAQTTTGSSNEKVYFQNVVRPQFITHLQGATQFDVTPVPIPGAVWLLGSALAGMTFVRRRAADR